MHGNPTQNPSALTQPGAPDLFFRSGSNILSFLRGSARWRFPKGVVSKIICLSVFREFWQNKYIGKR